MEKNTYIPAERQKKMMEYIEANTSAQIHELAEKFHVSEATVRRDLDDLDQQGALRRTHGGAIKVDRSTSYDSMYSEKINQMIEESTASRTLPRIWCIPGTRCSLIPARQPISSPRHWPTMKA